MSFVGESGSAKRHTGTETVPPSTTRATLELESGRDAEPSKLDPDVV